MDSTCENLMQFYMPSLDHIEIVLMDECLISSNDAIQCYKYSVMALQCFQKVAMHPSMHLLKINMPLFVHIESGWISDLIP